MRKPTLRFLLSLLPAFFFVGCSSPAAEQSPEYINYNIDYSPYHTHHAYPHSNANDGVYNTFPRSSDREPLVF